MQISDAQLVKKAQNNDTKAFEELIKRYEKKIYNLAYRIMGNREDAKDMLQDTFLQVFRKLSGFKGDSAFSTWLYRIAVNTCLMKKRKEKNMKTVSMDTPILTMNHDEIKRELSDDWSKSPLASIENEEIRETIQKAVKSLPEDYRAVFVLRGVKGMSNQKIAKILDISLPAVKSRLHRARLFLRDRLSKYFADSGGSQ